MTRDDGFVDEERWSERWTAGQIGFHEGSVNALLAAHAGVVAKDARVLVPLCGKAFDLAWLAARSAGVVGVEGVALAKEQFFAEHPGITGVDIVVGDFFDVTREQIGDFDLVYDRAALVAIEPALRARYVGVLRRLLRPRGKIFLIAFAYDQSKTPGPPFSLDDASVRALFRDGFTVDVLEARPSDVSPRMREAGVNEIIETAYLIARP